MNHKLDRAEFQEREEHMNRLGKDILLGQQNFVVQLLMPKEIRSSELPFVLAMVLFKICLTVEPLVLPIKKSITEP